MAGPVLHCGSLRVRVFVSLDIALLDDHRGDCTRARIHVYCTGDNDDDDDDDDELMLNVLRCHLTY